MACEYWNSFIRSADTSRIREVQPRELYPCTRFAEVMSGRVKNWSPETQIVRFNRKKMQLPSTEEETLERGIGDMEEAIRMAKEYFDCS